MDDAAKVAQEDELIERIAREIEREVFKRQNRGVYLVTGYNDSQAFARAILPFIHEAHIEGGKMVQDKIVEWLRVQQHGRTSDNYPAYYARRIEDGEWK